MPLAATPAGTPRPRLVELDVLRAAAMGLVLVNHLYAMPFPASWPGWSHRLFDAGVRGGWVGVDLFFVLSGYLVSGLLFAEYRARGTLTVKRFYARRAWKIYPAYYAMLAVTIVGLALAHGKPPTGLFLSEALFVQNYLPGVWLHTWSLAAEEHFYLLLPLVLLAFVRRKPGAADPFAGVLPLAVLTVGVTCLTLRVAHAELFPEASFSARMSRTHFRIDGLFAGVLVGYLAHFHAARFVPIARRWRWPLIAGGCVALIPPFVLVHSEHVWFTTGGFTVNTLASCAILAGVLHLRLPANSAVAATAYLGRCSYAIYLWHIPWVLLGIPQLERLVGEPLDFAPRVAVYVIGSVGLGVLMTKLIEVPTLRLREKWSPATLVSPTR
jgi:peptidoglycan/LPS O-acetylase OafA/YrhL